MNPTNSSQAKSKNSHQTPNQSFWTKTIPDFWTYTLIVFTWAFAFFTIPIAIGDRGLWSSAFETSPFLKLSIAFFALAHITITAMSLSFHRAHTHQAVRFNPVLDALFQTWLWCVSSMSKLDWVSVHIYHHATSDTPKDPHSPVQKGLARVFFMGALDYNSAKSWPEVLKIRNRLPRNAYEQFIADHVFLGPILMATFCFITFGPLFGSILAIMNFVITPLFAVGGVNALAHYMGYRNYSSQDNSRNIGFIFPLNFIICGELDHNNHHHYPKSPSFAHRWYEFDIGWLYVRALRLAGLAKVMGTVPKVKSARDSLESALQENQLVESEAESQSVVAMGS
jgi:stearoyl-CoA desaturase (delta-9 desaturase)